MMPTFDLTPLLDPELRTVFSSMVEVVDATHDPVGAKKFRDERFARLASEGQGASAGGVTHEDLHIPGPDGVPLLVRVHGADPAQRRPAIVWLHGGGFSGGSALYEDPICQYLATSVGAVVVSVEYRLLPDHPFPAAIEDTYAAFAWVSENATRLGVDPARMVLGGLSAGATLAAGATQMIRDRGQLQQAFQLLMYGSFDNRLLTPSSQQFQDRRSPTRAVAANMWRAYLADHIVDPPPYAVPARTVDLSGLPDAYVLVGTVEIARDENIAYAQRLLEAGVATELHVAPGTFHGFDVLVPDARISRDAREGIVRALQRKLEGKP